MLYQDKYSVLVVSSGYAKVEKLEIKIYGKLNDGTKYDISRNVSLSSNRVEKVEFDVSFVPCGLGFWEESFVVVTRYF